MISGTGKTLDLQKHRTEQLQKLSSFAASFKYDAEVLRGKAGPLMKPWYDMIPEFPVPIEDRELWKSCLEATGAEIEADIGKSFFALDFLFPLPGLVVEIDSKFHKGREKADKARDMYLLSKYGLETIRYYEYGKDSVQRDLDRENFKKTVSWLWKRGKKLDLGLPVTLDFSETAFSNFFRYHKSAVLLLDAFKRYTGPSWITERNIKIPKSELPKIDPKTFKKGVIYKEGDLENMLLQDAIILGLSIYGKSLEIT